MSGILSMLSGGTYSTKPDAPTIGAATVTGTTTATVAFTAPAKDGGVAITSYTATSSPHGVTGTLSQAGSGTITVSGLTTGTAYTFTVTATNSVGTSAASSASNSITTYLAPANTVAPAVSGTATVGQTLSSTTGTWNGIPAPTFGYQWQRAGSNIGGATSSTYTLVDTDYANTILCVVTATNAVSAVAANSNSTASVAGNAPVNTVTPVVSGTATRGQTLSSTTGTWTGVPTPTFGYQWQRAGSNISGATSSTYVLVSADVGNAIRCVVTATNAVSAVSANSNATAAVAAQVPGAPTSVSATATAYNAASVSFSAPADNGGATITNYSVSGGGSGSGASSPISVTGLSGGTSYTFSVAAANSAGTGPSGSASAITTPDAPPTTIGQSYGGGYYAGLWSENQSGTATHYLVVSPKASGEASGLTWGTYGVTQYPTARWAEGGTNTGPQNSASLAGQGANYQAAQFCENLSIGGYTDWYLPSYAELVTIYYFLKPSYNTSPRQNLEGQWDGQSYYWGVNPYAVSPQPSTKYSQYSPPYNYPDRTSVTAFQETSGGHSALTFNSEAFTYDSGTAAPDLAVKHYWSCNGYSYYYAWAMNFKNGNWQKSNCIQNRTTNMTRAIRRVPV